MCNFTKMFISTSFVNNAIFVERVYAIVAAGVLLFALQKFSTRKWLTETERAR